MQELKSQRRSVERGVFDAMRPNIAVAASWIGDERGSITVEYVVLLSFVALGCALAVVGLGSALVRQASWQEAWILMALP